MSQPYLDLEAQEIAREIISRIDPALEFVRPYGFPSIWMGTCKVLRGDQLLIVKYFDCPDGSENDCFEGERKALELLKGVERVSRLVETYNVSEYVALAKTYVDGMGLDEFVGDKRHLVASGVEVVTQVHARGVCNLDIRKEDNLLVKEGLIWLFDFDTVSLREDFESDRLFERRKQRDAKDLAKVLL
jgi:predicted Ser/Thr protein kinase